ncbi:MAG TPA: DUF4190 domain-containing protein [Abditibacteriaceae bacterium]|jgi:hypothetical protein
MNDNSPFGPPIPAPGGYGSGQGPYSEQVNGTMVLVLGILGITICGCCAPFAWIMGNNALAAIDAGRANPTERGNAHIGRILGMIGTGLIVLGLLAYIVLMMVGGAIISQGNRMQPPNSTTFAPAPGGLPPGQ